MLKIVIDTNALIDGSEDFYHYASRILDLVIAGKVEAFVNHGTLSENKLLIGRKIYDEEYLRKLDYYFGALNMVRTRERIEACEDEEDNKILEAAVSADADYLITSDRHLLDLNKFRGINIVRPAEFWSRWEDEGDGGWAKWMKDFVG
jgi:putative PIN family toxin of toxin-antitoxin system